MSVVREHVAVFWHDCRRWMKGRVVENTESGASCRCVTRKERQVDDKAREWQRP